VALSIEEVGQIDGLVGQWCLSKVPPKLKNKIDHDYEVDGQAVTIFEIRPHWRGELGEITRRPSAKFRFVKTTELWNTSWMRQSGKRQAYAPASAASSLNEALHIIDTDSCSCFFG